MSWLQALFTPGPPKAPAMPSDLPDPAASSLPLDSDADPSTDSLQPPPTVKVAVLLDGDADFFTSAYLLKGYRGGRSAALDLRNKVNALVHNRYRQVAGALARPPEVFIVAQSFLNMVGLSNHLRGVGLRTFAQGFSSSGLAFSMIDVGSQKQAADDAIKAHLPFLLATCDVVLLGGSHDGGYAADLLRLDPEVLRTKVVLLRTTDFAAERILELGLDEVRFEGLFDGTDPSSGRKPAFLARASAPALPFFASSSTAPFQPFRKPSLPGGAVATSAVSAIKPPPPASYSSTVALRPNGLVASSSSSPAQLSPMVTAAKAPTPEPYAPLVLVLRDFASRGQRRPSRVDVEQALRVRYPALGGYFKRYALEAALKGIVRLGKGEKAGADWVELVEEAAGQAVQQGEHGKEGIEPVATAGGNRAVASTSTSTAPPLAQSAPAAPSSSTNSTSTPTTATPMRFLPLLALLKAQREAGRARPLCAWVGEHLARSQPGLYAHFTTYCRQAEKAGLVRMGVGEKVGSEYIELASNPSTTSAPRAALIRAPTSSSFSISAAFLPLVSVLLSTTSPTPRSALETKLDLLVPKPYEEGKFKQYVSRAEQAKVVDTNYKDEDGETCVKLTAAARAAALQESKRLDAVKDRDERQELGRDVPVRRNISWATPPWTLVGDKLAKVIPMPYEQGRFKVYIQAAQAAGIVETGKLDKEGQHWMRLTLGEGSGAALDQGDQDGDQRLVVVESFRQLVAGEHPPAFLPLVKVLLSSSMPLPTWSAVANELRQIKPLPYEQGALKGYLARAEQAGFVKTGKVDHVEEHWIRLTATARAGPQSSATCSSVEKSASAAQAARPGCC